MAEFENAAEKIVRCQSEAGPSDIAAHLDEGKVDAANVLLRECFTVRTDHALMNSQAFQQKVKEVDALAKTIDKKLYLDWVAGDRKQQVPEQLQQFDLAVATQLRLAEEVGLTEYKGLLKEVNARDQKNIGCDVEIVDNGTGTDVSCSK